MPRSEFSLMGISAPGGRTLGNLVCIPSPSLVVLTFLSSRQCWIILSLAFPGKYSQSLKFKFCFNLDTSYANYFDSFISIFSRINGRVFESGIHQKFAFYLWYLVTGWVGHFCQQFCPLLVLFIIWNLSSCLRT